MVTLIDTDTVTDALKVTVAVTVTDTVKDTLTVTVKVTDTLTVSVTVMARSRKVKTRKSCILGIITLYIYIFLIENLILFKKKTYQRFIFRF